MTSTEKIFLAGGAVGLYLALTSGSSKSGSLAAGMMGEYFSYDEFVGSNTCEANNIPNVPNYDQLNAGKLLAQYILDPLRHCLGPVHVSSWLRVPDCNHAVGGVSDSTHLTGGTADLYYLHEGIEKNWLIMRCLLANELPFDRVLIEYGTLQDPETIHVEFNPDLDPDDQRQQIWRINKKGFHGYQMDRLEAEQIYL